MKDKIFKSLENRNWKLLNHYCNEYPMDWISTINKCLQDERNLFEFTYDINGELKQIKIICPNQHYGNDWNFYIMFTD